ncbi:hypothetical protein ABW20_dc0108078 [Dactylellina cionopaga]|nr:hypothetical protein ABW20_dc0108078 [Dactylellina cionopaga]
MIGTSLFDLIKIRIAIIFIRGITPLSVIYTVSLPFLPATFLTPTVKLLSLYPIAETAFYFLYYLPRKHALQGAAEHPPLPALEERKSLFLRILQTIPDHTAYLRQWFLGADIADIKRDNAREFLRWSLFNSSGSWSEESDGDSEHEEEVEEYVAMLEEKMGHKFEEGRGKAVCYRLTIDQVKMKHRPLAWYMLLGAIDTLTYIRLRLSTHIYHRRSFSTFFSSFPFRLETVFTSHKTPVTTTAYWSRPHRSKTHKPILYIHGIGIGLHPYVEMLNTLASTLPDVGILILEIDPVCSRICAPMLKRAEMLEEILTILSAPAHKTSYESFVLAANSYGTVIATHMLHDSRLSPRIISLVLIDPVTILLHLPDVAYNFLRREPKRANERMLHYFASTDQMVAHTLCRRFFWAENILWVEDLKGRNAVVYLGERDLIVDTGSVRRYLTGKYKRDAKVVDRTREEVDDEFVEFVDSQWVKTDDDGGRLKVVWCEELDHAQVFDYSEWYTRLVKDIGEVAAGDETSHIEA